MPPAECPSISSLFAWPSTEATTNGTQLPGCELIVIVIARQRGPRSRERGGSSGWRAGVTDDDDRRERAHEAEQAVIRQAPDLAGPWPALTTSRAQNVEVLDVDRYEKFGVALSTIERSSLSHGPALRADVFRRDNGWQPVCGASSGGVERGPLGAAPAVDGHDQRDPEKWRRPMSPRAPRAWVDRLLRQGVLLVSGCLRRR